MSDILETSEEEQEHWGYLSKHFFTTGIVSGQSAGLVVEILRLRIPAGAAGEISSPESTFCADSYSVSVQPCVIAMARKRPRSSAKSAGGRLHLNTHTPLTQRR